MSDPQKTWEEYYARIKNRKIDEATQLWNAVVSSGANEETVFAIDFSHFCDVSSKLNKLAQQLSENYEIELSEVDEKGYQFLTGTTRPYGNELSEEDFINWVSFMCDVAQSYTCVFSEFSLESPELGLVWSNTEFESEKYS
ncbi:hypothetical protein RA178_02940 [Shewanella oncorhynchi]|uniref:Uncharacterized protein n=2 Tax=Shewanella TaxID=22 RepID=A0AA50KEK0_9GAMM|nr:MULTISPECIES: hypothetical protein [Shewanella]MCU8010071.1 hypothetical protein [Shewanella sp. SM87]MCU8057697.1 hypothetical protein [Shewanella sp. SM35]MCU8066527.1 hypothetical protein [Shewanella sp. SM34]MCU8075244.1 hypothetical protein [Shewanella sp. SM29]PIW62718.1 MAG: hypothetical protein COW15_02120 [Shewanella sp. CG12_big_fil_rev_8_21_14_0_65_47_15]